MRIINLIYLFIFLSLLFDFSCSQGDIRKFDINWEAIDDGGEVRKFSDGVYNITHLKGNKGDVMLLSVESFKIDKNSFIEWSTFFMIVDVVDPSGEKHYGDAETRQRITIIDSENLESILPFDFGFFEATHEKPLGNNELWIFWRTTTDVLLCYNCLYNIRVILNSSYFSVEIFDESSKRIWESVEKVYVENKRLKLAYIAGENVGRGGNIVILNTTIRTNIRNFYDCIAISRIDETLFKNLEKSLLKVSSRRNCFPLFINTSDPFEIKSSIKQTYETLRSLNLLSTLEPEIIIVGDFSEIPKYPIRITDSLTIYSDYHYADLNNDSFQDFPIRRLCCSLEEINLQIEAKRLSRLNNNVLIAQSYLDIENEKDLKEVLLKGAFMDYALRIRDKLKYNNYNVERITERRFSNEDLSELIKKFINIVSLNEESDFSKTLNFLKNVFNFSVLLNNLFFEIELSPISFLEPLNSSNLLKYSNNSSIIFIFTLTQKERYILPSNKTQKEDFNISNLPFIEIVFDASPNNFENSLPYLKSFTKIGYKNHTKLISSSQVMKHFSEILNHNQTLSQSIKNVRNSFLASVRGISPSYLIYVFSKDYREYIEDWSNSIIFIGEDFKIINKPKPKYYSFLTYSNPSIKIRYENICSKFIFSINETNFTSFICNFTSYEYLKDLNETKIFYLLQEKIELPQFKSLKHYKINYSIIEIDELFPLVNFSDIYNIILVNNSNDVQEIYLNIYPARNINNKTILIKDFEIEIEYDNSFEVKNVYSQEDKLYIEIFSNIPRKVSIEIIKENVTVIRDLKEIKDFSKIIYKLKEGIYLVKIKYFEIEISKEINISKPKIEIPFFQKIFTATNHFFKIFENYLKREKEFINHSNIFYSLETPTFKLIIENSKVYFKGLDLEYQRMFSFSEEIEKLKCYYGYLEIGIKDGNYYEIFDGNYQKLKEKLFEVRKSLNHFLNFLSNKNQN